jgi:hypothetical protein
MMMFMRCITHRFTSDPLPAGQSCSDTAKARFPSLNSSQLSHEEFFVRAFVPSFCCSVLELTLEVDVISADQLYGEYSTYYLGRKRITCTKSTNRVWIVT